MSNKRNEARRSRRLDDEPFKPIRKNHIAITKAPFRQELHISSLQTSVSAPREGFPEAAGVSGAEPHKFAPHWQN